MVGLALIASGLFGGQRCDAARRAGIAAFVLSGLALLQLGAYAWELNGQAPLLDSVQARGLLAQAIVALLVGLLAMTVQSDRIGPVLLMAASAAIVPPLLTGHAPRHPIRR